MSQSIALMFRQKFDNVEMLKSQKPQLYDVLYKRKKTDIYSI